MPKFMYAVSYSADGIKGVMQEGGTSRIEAATAVAEALGATVEGAWFAFGDDDVYLVLDAPDNIAAGAGSILTGATGAVATRTIPLITLEEMDAMAAKAREAAASYRPPGS